MTPDTLSAIQARADSVPVCPLLVRSRDARNASAEVWMDDAGDLRAVARVNENWGSYADLFAASVTDIPQLVAYARRLEGEKGASREEGRRAGLEEARAILAGMANDYLAEHGGGGNYCAALWRAMERLVVLAASPTPDTTTGGPR